MAVGDITDSSGKVVRRVKMKKPSGGYYGDSSSSSSSKKKSSWRKETRSAALKLSREKGEAAKVKTDAIAKKKRMRLSGARERITDIKDIDPVKGLYGAQSSQHRVRAPLKADTTLKEEEAAFAGTRDQRTQPQIHEIIGSKFDVQRNIQKMEKIGIPQEGKITKRIRSGQEKTASFLQERKQASEKLGLVGLPTAKIIGAMSNVNQMFTGVPRAAEVAIREPRLIAPGAAIIAHGATVGTAHAFVEDPLQTTVEFMLMGKSLHLTSGKLPKTPSVKTVRRVTIEKVGAGKTKTTALIKSEKAQVLLIKPKTKVKPKSKKAKPKAEPKVETINLMQDPAAMTQLRAAQSVFSNVKTKRASLYSQKNLSKLRAEQKIRSVSRQKAKVRTLEQKIYALGSSIKMKQEFGQSTIAMQKRLARLKSELAAEQKAAIKSHMKGQTVKTVAVLKAETKAVTVAKAREMLKLKQQAKQVTTAKQKAVLTAKAKVIHKSLVVLRAGLITYSKTIPDTTQKHKVVSIANTIDKTIVSTLEDIKTISNTKLIPKAKRIIKPRVTRKPGKRAKPTIKVKVPRKPVIAAKRPKHKAKTKKKKKMSDAEYNAWFIRNKMPTLKSLYAWK